MTKPVSKKTIKSAGERALEEAAAREKKKNKVLLPKEHGGSDGLEPTRYGDWEKKGITSDF